MTRPKANGKDVTEWEAGLQEDLMDSMARPDQLVCCPRNPHVQGGEPPMRLATPPPVACFRPPPPPAVGPELCLELCLAWQRGSGSWNSSQLSIFATVQLSHLFLHTDLPKRCRPSMMPNQSSLSMKPVVKANVCTTPPP